MPLRILSPAFFFGATIPVKFTGDGRDVSPPLNWSDPPRGTQSFALVVHDPDAPEHDWVHWVLYNIPPRTLALTDGSVQGALPNGTREGVNDWGGLGWRGPKPPAGSKHRYMFDLYALDGPLPAIGTPTRAELQSAMDGHVLAQTRLIGMYASSLKR